MIWYFCTVKLPYEFLIPYEEKELFDKFKADYLTVKRQLYFDEQVQHFGLEYFNRRVEAFMKQKRREQKEQKEKKALKEALAKNEQMFVMQAEAADVVEPTFVSA
jgi:hypothetical protein